MNDYLTNQVLKMYRQELLKVAHALYQCNQSFSMGRLFVDVPEPLITEMQELPPIKEMVGRCVNLASSATSINVYEIARLIVMGVSQKGVDATVDSLIDYASIDYTPCVQVLLLRGVKVSNTFELLDGVFIAKPEDVPSLSLNRFLNQYKYRLYSGAGFDVASPFSNYESDVPPDSVIYRVVRAQPKFFPMEMDLNLFEESAKKHQIVSAISNLLPLIFPEVSIRHNYYASTLKNSFLEELDPQSWSLSGWGDIGVECREAAIEDLEGFRDILNKYLKLNDEQRSRLDVPLHRLREAARHRNPVDRAIDLGVALESLLLSDQSDQIQLGLQFRLRGAWLLGKNPEERKAIYKHLKEIYGYRSSAAHGGRLTKKIKDYEYASGKLIDGLKLCANAIKAVIDEAEVNWDDLLLGIKS